MCPVQTWDVRQPRSAASARSFQQATLAPCGDLRGRPPGLGPARPIGSDRLRRTAPRQGRARAPTAHRGPTRPTRPSLARDVAYDSKRGAIRVSGGGPVASKSSDVAARRLTRPAGGPQRRVERSLAAESGGPNMNMCGCLIVVFQPSRWPAGLRAGRTPRGPPGGSRPRWVQPCVSCV